ncbi:MAG: BlaI/MecI/CopY family transcriptional regulator [Deltaproteobacteria bacterium]|nr:BlaI/MecI/CopY family transcriptional regulator [Deltaproteobacteria bacterium]
MSKVPKISESEWLVMKAIWDENPISSNRVVEILSDSTQWNPKTIKTLLTRLVKKGAVGFETEGRSYLYYPLIEEQILVKEESKSFLKRVFRGALKPMIATMVESEDLSVEEIEELKRLLSKK